ncbi:S8/S53 family peptidase [Actinomadura sp. WMMB 499]|uniref:S8 family peptidase n=1 Tax=Actinomadura sp. WMMB 499 TaxID=1219491 RepID=UPI00159DC54D|nr:S8/S53 family peptidase [Actinomadura sp. WMMB 499]
MFDQQAVLERVLARHRDAVVVEPVPGRPALIRRDQLLVAGHDAAVAEDLVRRWCDGREDGAGVARLRLRAPARPDVCELAAELGGDGPHRRLAVAPNHLVHGQPLWWSGPADRPRPASPVPAPRTAADACRDVTVAILDTGLSPHPWYADADWFREQPAEDAEVLDADLDRELDVQAGHGTFVAGVVLRHAPAARLLARRVLGGDGVGDELGVIRALARLAERDHADVVNLSLGCHTYDDRPSPVLSHAIRSLGRRTVVVACAGNAASDRPFWPAALKSVIGVAALDGDDRAWFSNYGWWVDAAAPGVDVASSFVRFDGPRPPAEGADPDRFDGFATWSGTSFATPMVTGLIARLAASEDIGAVAAADKILDQNARATHPDLGVIIRA